MEAKVNAFEAQKQCNFVLFAANVLPLGLSLKEQSLRLEAADKERSVNYNASFRQLFENDHRAIIIKQFLYDWAPPAYDYPCLWRNAKIATQEESPAPNAVFIGNNALWIGKNYRKQNAATIEIERTRIELTINKGTFSDNELVSIAESFTPVDNESAKDILKTSFAQLAYSQRHSASSIDVPVGYWKHHREAALTCYSLGPDEAKTYLPNHLQTFIKALETRNYSLNSGFGFGSNKTQLREIELIFEHQKASGSLIRILYRPTLNANQILVPPALGDQECHSKTFSIKDTTFYYATSAKFAFGSHEIVFNKDSLNCMLLIKPAPWTTMDWVMELLNSLSA